MSLIPEERDVTFVDVIRCDGEDVDITIKNADLKLCFVFFYFTYCPSFGCIYNLSFLAMTEESYLCSSQKMRIFFQFWIQVVAVLDSMVVPVEVVRNCIFRLKSLGLKGLKQVFTNSGT